METMANDIVLIYHDNEALGYARVEDITADVKPGWWCLTLLLLNVPLQPVTWILREEYIEGAPFSMGGRMMRLERLPRPRALKLADVEEDVEPVLREKEKDRGQGAKIITLRPRKKNKTPSGNDIA